MELTEDISSINRQLTDLYGIDTITGQPIWRVVWSEDQYEKRLVPTNDQGIYLSKPEVREVPKYRQWIQNKYVIERLTLIPEINREELPTERVSYEPIWVFEESNGNYLPPRLDAAKFLIDSIYAAIGKKTLANYKSPEEEIEDREIRLKKIHDELFGNETDTGDALAHKQAIVVPRNYKEN